ncbi:endothelin-converting enzyme, partial [Aphelenchoides avenae]
AFESLRNPTVPSITVPELKDYSARQLFFMSYGQFWCSNSRPEAARVNLMTDDHSPTKFRVNGVVMNSPEFAAAFNCPQGSPMNPQNKCIVW